MQGRDHRAMARHGAVSRRPVQYSHVHRMASMAVSGLRVIGQVGTTIRLGLLFDTGGPDRS